MMLDSDHPIITSMHNDIQSIGFQRVLSRVEDNGQRQELWARSSPEGPVLVSITFPRGRERKEPT